MGVYQPSHVRPGVIYSNNKSDHSNDNHDDHNSHDNHDDHDSHDNKTESSDHKNQANENNPDLWRKLNSAHGEIFKFRVSLWREHLNRLEPVLADPWTEECTRFVWF